MSHGPYYHNGIPYEFPLTREEAKTERAQKYIDTTGCLDCGKPEVARYTKSAACVPCSNVAACEFYSYCVGSLTFVENVNGDVETRNRQVKLGPNTDRIVDVAVVIAFEKNAKLLINFPAPTTPAEASKVGLGHWVSPRPCPTHGHIGIKDLNRKCWFCEIEKQTPSPRQKALANGETWYTPAEPCRRCGVSALKNVHNGSCRNCNPPRPLWTPRQKAISDGLTWYTPAEPCPRCNTLAERNVHNGACRGCKPTVGPADNRKTPDSILMESQPDFVMGRADAKRLGLKVFRTGKPCRKGHTSFRYISTGNCIECLRGSK